MKPGTADTSGPNIRKLIDMANQRVKEITIVADSKKVSLNTENVKVALKSPSMSASVKRKLLIGLRTNSVLPLIS